VRRGLPIHISQCSLHARDTIGNVRFGTKRQVGVDFEGVILGNTTVDGRPKGENVARPYVTTLLLPEPLFIHVGSVKRTRVFDGDPL
jgi:hypothetical protein